MSRRVVVERPVFQLRRITTSPTAVACSPSTSITLYSRTRRRPCFALSLAVALLSSLVHCFVYCWLLTDRRRIKNKLSLPRFHDKLGITANITRSMRLQYREDESKQAWCRLFKRMFVTCARDWFVHANISTCKRVLFHVSPLITITDLNRVLRYFLPKSKPRTALSTLCFSHFFPTSIF
jgi:hypothetical protein